MEGGSISGTVNIGPQLGKRISIKISIRGRILLGHGGDYRDGTVHTFLRLSVYLPPPVSVDYDTTFCIPLPREVLVSSGSRDSVEVVKLPSSFAEPKFPVRVVYDLVLKVKRRWWQQDIKLRTFLGYSQGSTRPISSSACRGWQTLEPVTLKGTIFSEREVEVHYTLSLSKPLCYNRGCTIYCYMIIKSHDTQALDLLSNPSALQVNLERRVRYRNFHMHTAKSNQWLSVVDNIAVATWRPSCRRRPESYRRFLKGEIRLKDNLSPSMTIVNMAIEYMVTMRASLGAGFQPNNRREDILLSEPVEITTSFFAWPSCSNGVSSVIV